MSTKRLLTLLTDFGLQDVYVGVMKGVIAQIDPNLTVIDLTHQIPPQDVAAARFSLMNAYPYFPDGAVHVAVVDPGVGGARRAIAIELEQGFLVGPDNGLFSGVLSQHSVKQAVELTNPQYWRITEPSTTFHGRDIFAAVGAYLATNIPLTELGETIDPDSLTHLPIPDCISTESGFAGNIQYIDRFGNAITTILGHYVAGRAWSAVTRSCTMPGCRTYEDVEQGSPLAIVGSHGWVEIAVNGGDAHFQMRLSWGDPVEVVFQ
jgi:S-adenosyl-L-methionine hydrolase (adenosine-forming)